MNCDPTRCPMKDRIAQLERIVLYGAEVPKPDMEAIAAAFYAGDSGPLEAYIKRGGDRPSEGYRQSGHDTQEHRSLSSRHD